MGNNVSNTRKLSASGRRTDSVRKSSISAKAHTNLDEEFSDLILHEVKRKQDEQKAGGVEPPQNSTSETGVSKQNIPAPTITARDVVPGGQGPGGFDALGFAGNRKRALLDQYKQFSNDLIEDEFNELNDGLLETDAPELARNIIPHEEYSSDAMNIDETTGSLSLALDSHNRDETPTPDLSKVDFTKIVVSQDMSHSRMEDQYVPTVRHSNANREDKLIAVEIKWVNSNKEPISKIAIIGSFSSWRNVIRLEPSQKHANEYTTTIKLPLGVHKLLYIINNEYRVSEQLPTATDQEGILFNWFEVLDEVHLFNHSQNQSNHVGASTDYDANIISPFVPYSEPQTAGKHEVDRIKRKLNSFLAKVSKEELVPDVEHVEYMEEDTLQPDSGALRPPAQHLNSEDSAHTTESNKFTLYNDRSSLFLASQQQKHALDYSNEIPEMFVNYDFFKHKSPNYELPEPPQLPAHLNNVLLNKIPSQGSLPHNPASLPTITQHQNFQQVQQFDTNTYRYSHTPPPPALPTHSANRPPLRRADSSYYAFNQEDYHLSIPNHVILNHLMTTSIKNDVLTVACITRYSGKFVTQIMHSPADP